MKNHILDAILDINPPRPIFGVMIVLIPFLAVAAFLAGCQPTPPGPIGGFNGAPVSGAADIVSSAVRAADDALAKDPPAVPEARDHLSVAKAATPEPSAVSVAAQAATVNDAAKLAARIAEAESALKSARDSLAAETQRRLAAEAERDQARKDREADAKSRREADAARDKTLLDRILYGVAGTVALAGAVGVGLGIYLGARRLIIAAASLIPIAGVIAWLPKLLASEAIQKLQVAIAWILGAAVFAVAAFAVYEIIRWLRRAKPAVVAATLAAGVKSAL